MHWNPIWLSQLNTAASFTAETNFLVHEFMDFRNQKAFRCQRNPFNVICKQFEAEKLFIKFAIFSTVDLARKLLRSERSVIGNSFILAF